jgi:hypothetical protein
MVAARRLFNYGGIITVDLLTEDEDQFTLVVKHQLGILKCMGVRILAVGVISTL